MIQTEIEAQCSAVFSWQTATRPDLWKSYLGKKSCISPRGKHSRYKVINQEGVLERKLQKR